jgi:hypothetical protein
MSLIGLMTIIAKFLIIKTVLFNRILKGCVCALIVSSIGQGEVISVFHARPYVIETGVEIQTNICRGCYV